VKVKDILTTKGSDYFSIAPEITVKEAMESIADKKIGALLVISNEKLVGIITERDIFRMVASHNEEAFEKPVADYMTTKLIVGLPEDSVDVAMAYMTNNRFRHLPIVDNNKVVGIISIGDLVKTEVKNLKVEKILEHAPKKSGGALSFILVIIAIIVIMVLIYLSVFK